MPFRTISPEDDGRTELVVQKITWARCDAREVATTSLKNERENSELPEQFIAVLGHDLRNPLASISAGARILQRSGFLHGEKELRVLDMLNTTRPACQA
jgi:signal transduction histidine kinase